MYVYLLYSVRTQPISNSTNFERSLAMYIKSHRLRVGTLVLVENNGQISYIILSKCEEIQLEDM